MDQIWNTQSEIETYSVEGKYGDQLDKWPNLTDNQILFQPIHNRRFLIRK